MTAAKKKKASSSKKEKSTNDGASYSSSPTQLLLRIFPFWVALIGIFMALYWKESNRHQSVSSLSFPEATSLSEPNVRVAKLLFLACRRTYCHPHLQVSKRSLRATERIPQGEKLFEIPRSMHLWDLDAYRDPYVRKHLFKASHKISGNRLSQEAFLAAYLALELHRAEENPSSFDAIRLAYFDSLPTYEEFLAYHPAVQDKDLINELLGRSAAQGVLQGYRNMINAEWEAFSAASPHFENMIGQERYLRARLIVLSRVLHVGPPGPEEVMAASFIGQQLENQDLLLDELYSYQDLIGVNLTDASGGGCIALIPLADLFNHHPNNNVDFQYKKIQPNGSGRSFVVSAVHRNIEKLSEPMASYGTLSDAHLYGRYGFNNGDGSGPIQLNLAFHHDMMKLNMTNDQYNYLPNSGTTPKFRNYQKRGLIKYLMYDDGYDGCIPGPTTHPEEAELKRLKLEHLLRIANDYERWNMLVAPRAPDSLPAVTSTIPITFSIPQFEKDFSYLVPGVERLLETCRMISLINSDFNGKAVAVLKENLDNSNFIIGPNVSDALEFRSYMCVSRWFGTRTVTMELRGKLNAEFQRLATMNRNAFGTFNWTALQVKLGEMQASQAGSALIFQRVSERWEDKKVNAEVEYTAKDLACPEEYATFLYKDDESSSGFLYY
ncbi:SET methyltransferase domain containing protein [Nitzschia inconspicua]|uniref:SET methyltransferase domain containing protein n=1 Tax=Nitzschia inconspicua TaxID=303405 RepID=A0A9K3KT23_9STRA|nr:SET methyltransferase domain containing protein [Nitzschia inconspicua]